MPTFAGRLLLADSAPEGWLRVQGGRVAGWGKGAPPDEADVVATGWIVPAPVNAHTHVADACLRSIPGKPLAVAELVGPGGWKARHLATAAPHAVAEGIRGYVREMAAIGTQAFIDFREGGRDGARLLSAMREELMDIGVRPVVMGRPARNDFVAAEADALLPAVDGIGLSALRDFANARDVQRWADACREAGKSFALHVSEAVREPMDAVVALEPAFVVHATQASGSDLDQLADEDIPVVVCPRSNAYHGLTPPVAAMRRAGLRVALGTDNGMLQDGDLLRDAGLVRGLLAGQADGGDRQGPQELDEAVLRMVTHTARAIAGIAAPELSVGAVAQWVVLPAQPFPPPSAQKPGFVVPAGGAR